MSAILHLAIPAGDLDTTVKFYTDVLGCTLGNSEKGRWVDSGSASIDFVLRRGSAAHTRKDHKLARRMFDHVTELSPNYAEGWARSSRLALDEKDLGRALNEAAQALILEPRHFYALWTMGNVFEQLGRCLLYTSPSPRDRTRSRMPSSA